MKTLIISSNCSGGGKTTVTLGLMKALKNLNYSVQGYKVGPDYIDPAFHSKITGSSSRNLDIHLMGEEGVKESFARGSGDLAIIEGVMGLYDGKGITEEGSTYHISKVLKNAPIVLVVAPKAQSLTLCAEINGLKNFKDANIIGVIINSVSEKYYKLLKTAIEKNCNVDVFGYIPKDERIKLSSRHLGLIQSSEVENLKDKIEICAKLIEENINLKRLINSFKDISFYKSKKDFRDIGLKTAIAYDKAFSFYYKENIEILEELGEIIYFSPLKDKELPKDIDFLYIGGGYPEIFKEELNSNISMRESIKSALNNGLKAYAECGGLMYLTEKIDNVEMVGFFKGTSEMTNKLNRFGYATVNIDNIKINCHEFHKSLVNLKENTVYKVEKTSYDGEKISWNCGYKKNKVLAGYAHVHFLNNLDFLKMVLNIKEV